MSFAFARNDDSANATDSNVTPKGTEQDTSFRYGFEQTLSIVTIAFSHYIIRNSDGLGDWPGFAFTIPMWNGTFKVQKDFGQLLAIRNATSLDPNVVGIGVKSDITLSLVHLLDLSIGGTLGTAWNYGGYAVFMATYDLEKKDWDEDTFFMEYMYAVNYKASLTLPLLVVLPKSDWTKIILKGDVKLDYFAYTNADDGEYWKCGTETRVNGYSHKFTGTLIYMLPFEQVRMAMLSFSVEGLNRSTKVNEAYKDRDPYFKIYSVSPMLSFKFIHDWNGMFMLNFSRGRKLEHYHFESSEELLQKRVGAEWRMNMIMLVLSRKF